MRTSFETATRGCPKLLAAVCLLLALARAATAQALGQEVLSEKAGVVPVHARLLAWPPAVGTVT